MIQVVKPAQVPEVLLTKGKPEIESLKQQFDSDKPAYLTGTKKFIFKHSIYGPKSVKEPLWEAQRRKCVFCEFKKELGEGHVEHFRGKGGYQQEPGDDLGKPGYYWLAYEWENLFFACFTCNSTFKKNYFPLDNPADRALSHDMNLAAEKPLFIDPAKENPEDFIEFKSFLAKAVNGHRRGEITIERIGLNRKFHRDERLEHYNGLKKIWEIANQPGTAAATKQQLVDLLADYSKSDKSYSSMVKCALRDQFKF